MRESQLPELPVALLGMQVVNLVKLNILTVLCCLPVVTIGPALSAMNYVVNLYIEEKSDEVAKPFFKAFRRDFPQSLLFGLFLILMTGLTVFDGLFLLANYWGSFHPIWIPFLILVLFLAALYVYAFPMLCRYQLHFSELLKNAVVLFWQNLATSLGALLVIASPLLLIWLFPQALFEILFLWLLCGSALTARIINKGILQILDREQRRIDCEQITVEQQER